MNKNTKMLLTLTVVAVAGFYAYKKLFAAPTIELERLDWDTAQAEVKASGHDYEITDGKGALLANSYSVEFVKDYRSDLRGQGVARLELRQSGQTKKILAQYV